MVTLIIKILNSFSSFPSIGGGRTMYAGMSPDPFIVLIWLTAVFVAILFFIIMYWHALIVITNGDTNVEVKEIKQRLAEQAGEPYYQSDSFNGVQPQDTWNVNPAPTTQPESVYPSAPVYQENPVRRQEPAYQHAYQEAPKRVVVEETPSFT